MIHTYSLIHDDLPCMDNDDLRRGRPTCHKAFDEATAVLAGDGLLTAAFETASAAKDVPAETIVRCIRILGENAGMNGMIGGQVLDMGAEHRKISLDELRLLQKLKTGCLLRAACELGCAAAGATDEDTLARARAYGEKLGLAFQIEDDILDIRGRCRNTRKIHRQGCGKREIHVSVSARSGGMPRACGRADRGSGGRGKTAGRSCVPRRTGAQPDRPHQIRRTFT